MRITGHGHLGRTAGPGPGHRHAAAGGRARRQLHRHRGLLRPRGQRDADRRGAAPVPGRPGHRDQGRPGPAGPEPLGPRRPPRAPARGVRGQPAAAPAGADPAVPVPPARPEGAAGRVARRARRAEGRGQDPPHRRLQRDRGRSCARRSGSPRSCRSRTGTTSTDRAVGVAGRPVRAGGAWCSCPGRRSRRPSRSAAVAEAAERHGVTARQIALAWLLARSPAILPIPGHRLARAPRGERRRRGHRAEPRRDRGDQQGRVISAGQNPRQRVLRVPALIQPASAHPRSFVSNSLVMTSDKALGMPGRGSSADGMLGAWRS